MSKEGPSEDNQARVKTIRLTGVLIFGALILASCSSSTPSASSTTSTAASGSGNSTTTTTSGGGTAALSTVWPSCCAADLTAIGNRAETVGNDVVNIGKNGGGSTAQLIKDLHTMASAIASGQQSASNAASQVPTGTLTSYTSALSALRTATNNAVSACSSATNSCINDIQTITAKLKSVTTAASALNTAVTPA